MLIFLASFFKSVLKNQSKENWFFLCLLACYWFCNINSRKQFRLFLTLCFVIAAAFGVHTFDSYCSNSRIITSFIIKRFRKNFFQRASSNGANKPRWLTSKCSISTTIRVHNSNNEIEKKDSKLEGIISFMKSSSIPSQRWAQCAIKIISHVSPEFFLQPRTLLSRL